MKGAIPPNEIGVSALITFWGQFMDHDVGLTPEPEEGKPAEHMDIPIPKGDAHFDKAGTGN